MPALYLVWKGHPHIYSTFRGTPVNIILLNLFLVSFCFLSLEWYKWPCYWKNCKSVGRLSTKLTNELRVAETKKTGVTYFPKLCVVFKEKVKVKVELFKNILQRVVLVTHFLERKQFFFQLLQQCWIIEK